MVQDSILAIAEKYLIKVKRSGSENILAVCPFHMKDGRPESNPSFTMSLTKGVYFCFSCLEKGNLLTFLRNVGVSRLVVERNFRPLLDQVASFHPKKLDPLRPGVFTRSPLPENILGLFDYCPTDLIDQGFSERLLQKYDIGFDRVHMRITFPLRDLNGNLMGISGRTVIGEYPRYKLYDSEFTKWGFPEYHTDKRHLLWNADRVYPSAFFQNNPKVVVVEGFKACLWLIQEGIPYVVALLGVHLSEDQQWILERIGGTVYLMLDNNESGRIGTAKVGLRLSPKMKVKVAEYNNDKDQPSDLSATEIQYAQKHAVDFPMWITEENNKWLLEKSPPISAT